MSDEHFTRAPPIECRLISASMEIDDDDEDVIQVTMRYPMKQQCQLVD